MLQNHGLCFFNFRVALGGRDTRVQQSLFHVHGAQWLLGSSCPEPAFPEHGGRVPSSCHEDMGRNDGSASRSGPSTSPRWCSTLFLGWLAGFLYAVWPQEICIDKGGASVSLSHTKTLEESISPHLSVGLSTEILAFHLLQHLALTQLIHICSALKEVMKVQSLEKAGWAESRTSETSESSGESFLWVQIPRPYSQILIH